jgi:hypothetical protein
VRVPRRTISIEDRRFCAPALCGKSTAKAEPAADITAVIAIPAPSRSFTMASPITPETASSPADISPSLTSRGIIRAKVRPNCATAGHRLALNRYRRSGRAVHKPFKLVAAGWVSPGKRTPLAVTLEMGRTSLGGRNSALQFDRGHQSAIGAPPPTFQIVVAEWTHSSLP